MSWIMRSTSPISVAVPFSALTISSARLASSAALRAICAECPIRSLTSATDEDSSSAAAATVCTLAVCGGDLLLPGLVELHTDHLEAHFVPRPKVFWEPVAAVLSYDGQLASCGITTVLDSLRVWRESGAEQMDGRHEVLADAIAQARRDDLLRAEHFLHLRCEIPMPTVVADTAAMLDRADVRLISLMDHTPGQCQFRDEEKLRTYYRGKAGG